MNTQELKTRLAEIIRRDERHTDYERVVELSKLYTRLVTGEDMDALLHQFQPRESEAMFTQRKLITQHITKTVSQNVMDIFYKIPRSNSVQRSVAYKDNNTTKLKAINSKLDEFWGDDTLDDYMNSRFFELNFTDPNAFIVVEWKAFDNKKGRAMPYPFEVSSEIAIQYEYFNNDLVYLAIRQEGETISWDSKQKQDIKTPTVAYTIYGQDETIKFTKVSEALALEVLRIHAVELLLADGELFIGDYFVKDITKPEVYLIETFTPHNFHYVPARRVGFRRDLATKGRTFVSPLDKATPVLMKMIKSNSELDLTMSLHVFPQKIQYASRCKEPDCNHGHLADGGICGTCHGSGFETITTAQEVITLAMPKSKDEMIDLNNIIFYADLPTDIVTVLDKYVDKLIVQAKEAVFNSSELFDKKQVSETATGKNISLQSIYDSLYTIATSYSKTWRFLVTTIADATGLSKDLLAFYHFSKDFKLKSLTELYLDLKMVGDAKASEFIKSEIERDIATIIYSEDERALLKYNTKQAFYPFSGKTPDEVKVIIAGADVTKFTKVFYANYGTIFDEIELEQASLGIDFYYLAKEAQTKLIDTKVKEIITKVEAEAPKEPILAPLNGGAIKKPVAQ